MRYTISIMLVAGCTFPELATAPEGPQGPAPQLAPLASIIDADVENDTEAEKELEKRADDMRKRALDLPDDPIEPKTRQAMEAVSSS